MLKIYACPHVGAPFLWGPLCGRTGRTCLNPPLPTSRANLVLRVIWQCDRFGTTPEFSPLRLFEKCAPAVTHSAVVVRAKIHRFRQTLQLHVATSSCVSNCAACLQNITTYFFNFLFFSTNHLSGACVTICPLCVSVCQI